MSAPAAKEALAAKSLVQSIRATAGEDDALVIDMVEGETNLFEVIDKLLLRILESRGMVEALGIQIDHLETRKARFKQREAADRTLIEQALATAEIGGKVERATATYFLSARKPKIEVHTEAEVPAEFWRPGDPTLDKAALFAALSDGKPVPGASLSNAAPTLTVRFS